MWLYNVRVNVVPFRFFLGFLDISISCLLFHGRPLFRKSKSITSSKTVLCPHLTLHRFRLWRRDMTILWTGPQFLDHKATTTFRLMSVCWKMHIFIGFKRFQKIVANLEISLLPIECHMLMYSLCIPFPISEIV